MEKWIKKLDYFGKPITFTINNEYTHNTIYGALLTISLIMTSLGFGLNEFYYVYFRIFPIYTFYNTVAKHVPVIDIKRTNFLAGVKVEDGDGQTIKMDPRNFIIKSVYSTYQKKSSTLQMKIAIISLIWIIRKLQI